MRVRYNRWFKNSKENDRKFFDAWYEKDKEDFIAWCKAGSPPFWGNTIAPPKEGDVRGIVIAKFLK